VPNRLRDPETGLYNEVFFTASVPSRLASAKRALRPLSIVLLAVGGPQPGEVDDGAITGREVAYGLLRTLRESDLACRLEQGRFGLLLDETAADGAVLTVDRFRALLDEQGARHHLWAGVATYPTHALDSTSLLLAADAALRDAMAWRQSRIELATAS
jgi:diguanylate cyclase (GGDEF)-like protein